MATIAKDRPKVPRPARFSHLLACGIEAGVVATFMVHRSIVGCLLCLAYAWFSATWALAFRE